jgi:metallo-beta-lactamase class B
MPYVPLQDQCEDPGAVRIIPQETIGRGLVAILFGTLSLRAAAAQCPSYHSPEIEVHLDNAYRLATPPVPKTLIQNLFIVPRLAGLCAPARVLPSGNGPERPLPPTRAFDQLSYVGTTTVGAWVLVTSNGIILFDAMNDTRQASEIIEPGMRALGFDPAVIKIIILTHGHGDHWGGAKYLQDKYHARVLLGRGDANLLALRNEGRWPDPPRIDGEIRDSMTLTLGHSTVTLYASPGHTPGSITAIFPVTDHRVQHVVALSGGTGLAPQYEPDTGVPQKHAGLVGYIHSVERVMALGRAAHVDAAISTHPFFDGTIQKVATAQAHPNTPSPWVMGQEGWLRYEQVILEIAEAAAAMAKEHPERACIDPKGTAAVVCGKPTRTITTLQSN